MITFENIPRGLARGPPSIATTTATTLASDVGSVMRGPADAFSRSVTFFQKKGETEKISEEAEMEEAIEQLLEVASPVE